MDGDRTRAVEHLDRALDDLLAARVALGELPPASPCEALGEALEGDDEYRQARLAFRAAFEDLAERFPSERERFLALEETANWMASASSDVGWRLGSLAGRSR